MNPLHSLLDSAARAPSSHNSQPWRFVAGTDEIVVYPDHDRWLRVADHDKRELFISVGCAVENLVTAAAAHGYAPAVSIDEAGVTRVSLQTDARPADDDILARYCAIPTRHTNREAYTDELLTSAELQELVTIAGPDVRMMLSTDADVRALVDNLTVHADAVQFADPAWRAELSKWIGDGAFGQRWLVAKLAALAVRHLNMAKSTAKGDHAKLMHCPAIGVLGVRAPTPRAQVAAGRAFQRMWLHAETKGIRLHPMNQALQVAETAAELRDKLRALEAEPQLVFRLGRAPAASSRAPRRSIDEMFGANEA